MLDPLILLIMGILGYFMIRFGFSRITFALGLILGNIAEINFGISLQISETGALVFFTQPISLGLIALIVIIILFSVVMPSLKKRGAG